MKTKTSILASDMYFIKWMKTKTSNPRRPKVLHKADEDQNQQSEQVKCTS
ncbi:hypothetical protein [Metabacillus litoralis]|nr:hypothetical protein [Metabacillus litoralis]MCM3162321.1 hypothetical protein [Metabacillus litoralis]